MAWTVKRIVAENFLGLRRLDLDLSRYRGLTSIEGARPSPGRSNGTSKSSLLEALYWGIKGKLMRKLRLADKVRYRWAEKDERTLVRLTIDVDGREMVIERTRARAGGATLRTHLERADSTIEGAQAVIDRALGLPDDRALNTTAVFSGDMAQFCSMTDTERKAVLQRMVGADEYGAASELARQEAAEALNLAAKEDGAAANALREAELAGEERRREMARSILRASEQLAEEKPLVLAAVRASATAMAEHAALQEYYAGAQAAALILEGRRAGLDAAVALAQDAITAADTAIATADAVMSAVRVQVQQAARDRSNLEAGRHPDTCPTCSQRWPQAGMDSAALRKHLAAHDARVLALRASTAPHEAAAATARQARQEAAQARQRAQAELAEIQAAGDPRAERRLMAAALTAEANLRAAQDTLMAWRDAQPDPEWGELCVECPEIDARIEVARRKAADSAAAARMARDQAAELEFWRAGFGPRGFPAFLLDGSIAGMNEVVGRLAASLSDGELSVSFDPAAAKGSGDVFAVRVEYQDGADDYDLTSKGEHVRVDIPVMFTLRDLQERRGGNYCTQLFLDEVIDGCDQAFCEAFVRMLREHMPGRDVFIISHDDSMKALCDNTILVTKVGHEVSVA